MGELVGRRSTNLLTTFSAFARFFLSAVTFTKQPCLVNIDFRISSREDEISTQS